MQFDAGEDAGFGGQDFGGDAHEDKARDMDNIFQQDSNQVDASDNTGVVE